MSTVTAVPLQPVKRSYLVYLWLGIALALIGAVALARQGDDPLTRNARAKGVVTTASGLQYKVLTAGKPDGLAGGPPIEVAPLAYMRGRTLNDSFIILDEAQNTTPEQMKMFLTRLGFGSKIVVTGDITQVDLPNSVKSGLRIIEGILDDVDDISFQRLTAQDVVRHRLVGKIVAAYDEFDNRGGLATAPEQRR